jgi:hypothetical protein
VSGRRARARAVWAPSDGGPAPPSDVVVDGTWLEADERPNFHAVDLALLDQLPDMARRRTEQLGRTVVVEEPRVPAFLPRGDSGISHCDLLCRSKGLTSAILSAHGAETGRRRTTLSYYGLAEHPST